MPSMTCNVSYRLTLAAAAAAAAALWACGGAAPTTCGNGRLDRGELCDDGNSTGGDGCEADCIPTPRCGNGLVEYGEGCDDGNLFDDDACTNACQAGLQPPSDAGDPGEPPDGGPFSETGQDAGRPDAGTADAGTPEGDTPDAGPPDAGTPDAGTPDAGTPDAGTPDAGTPDAGTPDAGTPDAGPPPVTPNPYPHPDHVVISELQTRGAAGDPADEFVEFYNPTDLEVDLSGLTVRFVNSAMSITRTVCTFPGSSSCTCTGFSGRIPAHGFLLLATDVFAAQPGRPAPDCTWNTNAASGTLGEYGGHLQLLAPDGGMVDLLAWWDGVYNSTRPTAPESTPTVGLTGDGLSVERKAVSSATAADMASGGTHFLSGNSCDTDDNGADFVLRAASEPQNLSSPREP